MSQEIIGRSFSVNGIVQGVGFRWFARESALRLGVVGWVANREDGWVYGEVFGNAEVVAKFLSEVGRGPTLGRVDRVETTEIAAQAITGFTIRK
jgi:acylphosphatase